MGFNRFTINLIIRVMILFITLVVWAAIFLRLDLIFNQMIIATLVVFQVWSLIQYVTRTNKELSRFLDSIRDSDYTIRFEHIEDDPAFNKLNRSFGGLITKLGQLETEKNAQNLFLKALIEEIPFGLIVLEEDSSLKLINKHAQDSLNLPDVKHWQKLKSDRKHLLNQLLELSSDRPYLIEKDHVQLSVSITKLKLQQTVLRIISIKNIRSEILKKESDAWHQLIRVLTHEIMNSVTPISSITETLKTMLHNQESLSGETLQDVREAVDTVHSRSTGILTFVKKYRQLSRIPPPNKELVDIEHLLTRVIKLMQNNRANTPIQLTVDENTKHKKVLCDEFQIEQVLINLIKNAQEACKTPATEEITPIKCHLFKEQQNVCIKLIDEGSGISDRQLERIFIPFYTTKRNGSGIGLGLSRQIMINHEGTLTCESPMSPTIFKIMLPAN
jgi:two-component system nitrogen regulation sensor histidine kinase NtrY